MQSILAEQESARADTEYFASVLWSIGKMLGGDDYPMPTYTEYRHPKPKDTRSSESIIEGLREKLLAGGG